MVILFIYQEHFSIHKQMRQHRSNWLCKKPKENYANLHAVPPYSNQHQFVHVPSNLLTKSHTFVHHDAIRKLLQPVYDNPYRVISCTKKQFTREIKGRHEVSLDHLKPVYLDTEFSLKDITSTYSSPHTGFSNTVTTTCSSRKIHWPSNLLDQHLIVH